ncbi:MAG: FeoA family protein [bacterium]
MSILTLDRLKDGQSGTIGSLSTKSDSSIRLMEMGLFEGSRVTVLRRAPLGDPMEVQVGDYRLSLRRDEAALVGMTQ